MEEGGGGGGGGDSNEGERGWWWRQQLIAGWRVERRWHIARWRDRVEGKWAAAYGKVEE